MILLNKKEFQCQDFDSDDVVNSNGTENSLSTSDQDVDRNYSLLTDPFLKQPANSLNLQAKSALDKESLYGFKAPEEDNDFQFLKLLLSIGMELTPISSLIIGWQRMASDRDDAIDLFADSREAITAFIETAYGRFFRKIDAKIHGSNRCSDENIQKLLKVESMVMHQRLEIIGMLSSNKIEDDDAFDKFINYDGPRFSLDTEDLL